MNLKFIYIQICFVFLPILGFSQAVVKNKDFKQIAANHKKIAIISPKVNIEVKDVKQKEQLHDQEKVESTAFQKNIYDYLLNKKENKKFLVEIQPVEETNKILAEHDIVSLTKITYKELLDILDVDAIIISRISLSRPLTNAEAIFSSILAGPFFDSKVNSIDLSIIDRTSGRTFWNYNNTYGGTFSSSTALTKELMQSAVYRMPYFRN